MMHRFRAMLRQALTSGLSDNQIAVQRGMSHNTVRRWRRRAEALGITPERLDLLDDRQLAALIGGRAGRAGRFAEPDWQAELAFIAGGRTREEAHARYREQAAGVAGGKPAMAYRTYCEHLQRHCRTLDPVLRLAHPPGCSMQVDFAGFMPRALPPDGGPERSWKLFVAVLPCSGFMFACIAPSERTRDFVDANIAALERFGGVPQLSTCDNLKAGVLARPRHGPARLNAVYEAFGDHYGLALLPARPNRPRDKGAVENMVRIVQRLLRAALKDRPVPTLAELKALVAAVAARINARPMRRAGGASRADRLAQERTALRPLPPQRFAFFEQALERQVGRDYHVGFDHAFYSVPHALTGCRATVRASATTVEISVAGRLVATHPRAQTRGSVVTSPSHRPANHQAWMGNDLAAWARLHGEAAQLLVAEELRRPRPARVRQQRDGWITDLPRRHGARRFRAACERAVSLHDLRFEHVENVLKRGIEQAPAALAGSPPRGAAPCGNVRGAEYYGGDPGAPPEAPPQDIAGNDRNQGEGERE